MSDRSPSRARKFARWLVIIVILAIAGSLGYSLLPEADSTLFLATATDEPPLTATVQRASLPIMINAGGELTSSDAVVVTCQLEGRHNITEMIPEGTLVREGDVVIRLDPSEFRDRLAAQQIKVTQADAAAKAKAEELKIERNLADSLIAQAELALRLAELDQEKYLKGEYIVELNDLQGLIALANADLQDAQDEHEHFQDLVKKGFRTPEQLRSKEQAVKRARYNLSRDEERLRLLETYTRKRQLFELEAKVLEAGRELERAKSSAAAAVVKAETDLNVAVATADLERKQLARIQQQLELCDIRATSSGMVVYVKDRDRPIEEGGTARHKQRLFRIPMSNRMQVDAFVHESVVKQVNSGAKVEVRVDALPNLIMHGSVTSVASHYDGTRHWLSGGVKEYATKISIDESVDATLRGGMTAEARILVGEITDSLIVPISAVAAKDGQHYSFLLRKGGIEPKVVVIGQNTEDYVVVREGLSEGDHVALDARRRAEASLDLETAGPSQPAAEVAAR